MARRITTIPFGPPGSGYWTPWWPFSIVLCWLLSWHIAIVIDHFSRAMLGFRICRREPTGADICALLDDAVACAGEPPKYIVTDRGSQFRDEYRAWCERHGVRPRFGAIGQHGSIALIERFIRSLKQEFLRGIVVSASYDRMVEAMRCYQCWYDEYRPHASLEGSTPQEMLDGAPPPRLRQRIEPRARWPLKSKPSRDGRERAHRPHGVREASFGSSSPASAATARCCCPSSSWAKRPDPGPTMCAHRREPAAVLHPPLAVRVLRDAPPR